MKAHRPPRTHAFLLALGAALSWSGAAVAQEEAAPGDAQEAATTAELEAIFEARRDSARMRFTEADVDFMTGMIHHHAQAVVMGRMAPTHDASPQVRTLAARIINAQKDEIATMGRWLGDRGRPVPETGLEGEASTGREHEPTEDEATAEDPHAMHGAGHAHHGAEPAADPTHGDHMMPGMLTPAQIEELDRARGAEFDRLFLTYMIQHHEGGVEMVDELFATDGAAQDDSVFRIASDIQVDQRTEVARMESMLAALSDTDGAP